MCLVGSGESLGNWDVHKARRMDWTAGDVWRVEFEVAPGPDLELEYKYVVRNPDGGTLAWKPGGNCQVRVPVLRSEAPAVLQVARGVVVRDAWDGSVHDVEVKVARLQQRAAGDRDAALLKSRMERALSEVGAAVSSSMDLADQLLDPSAPELLQADRRVAEATRKAAALSRALTASRSFAAAAALPGAAAAEPGAGEACAPSWEWVSDASPA